MERAGHQLLARAARPLDQHGGVAGRDGGEEVEEPADGGAAADDVRAGVLARELFAQLRDLPEVLDGLHPADDLTGPSVFVTAEAPLSSYDLTPVIRARGGSTRLLVIAVIVNVLGAAWTLGAVAVGIKAVLLQASATPTAVSGY